MNGNWTIKMTGRGKIHPADADEIQMLMTDFIQRLGVAGHEVQSAGIKKYVGGEED